jgi:hypothetical protein
VTADRLVDAVAEHLDAYVFPDRAAAAVARMHARDYGALEGEALCAAVNEDLLAACDDKHLRLLWHSEPIARDDTGAEDLEAVMRERFRRESNGVRRVELLDGGTGLVELTILPPAEIAGDSFAAVFRLVEHTRALVLDLRGALGGAPDGVTLFAGYLLPPRTHFTDIVEGEDTESFWTPDELPAPRYLDRPVAALIGPRTFSGAESLAYELQARGRARIVGEPSRGGAHPSTMVALSERIELRLPVARPVSPVTGGNWEGTGIEPDVRVPEAEALEAALRLPAAP